MPELDLGAPGRPFGVCQSGSRLSASGIIVEVLPRTHVPEPDSPVFPVDAEGEAIVAAKPACAHAFTFRLQLLDLELRIERAFFFFQLLQDLLKLVQDVQGKRRSYLVEARILEDATWRRPSS
jgi:hypothetical protein